MGDCNNTNPPLEQFPPNASTGTWLNLTDTDPATYASQGGKGVRVNAAEDGLEFYPATGSAGTWIGLTDTDPTTFVGQAGKVVTVNAGATGLEFTTSSSGDFVGPAGSTDDAIVRFDGATGKLGQNSGVLISDTDDITGVATLTLPNTGLHLLDTNASHDLIIAPGSDLTADRTLTLTTGDSDRTITLTGNPTLNDWFDQSVKSGDSPTFDSTNFTGPGGQFTLARVAGSTFSTVQHLQDVFHSSGWVSGGGITDDTDGTITVAAGTGLIRATDSSTAQILYTDWAAEAGVNVNLTDNDTNYVYVEWNAGSPQVIATNVLRTDFQTNILLATIYRAGTNLHVNAADKHTVGDHANNMIRRLKETMPYGHVTGGILSETGTRNIALTAGDFWRGLTEFSTSAVDTSGAGTFSYWYNNGAWVEVATQTQIDDTQYNNFGTGLATLSNNRYGVHWVFLEADDDNVTVVYGIGDYTLTQAEDVQAPSSVPEHLNVEGILAGKIIIQESSATFTSTESAFQTTFQGSLASDHGTLAGLSDDDHTQYILVDGTRALTGNWDVGAFTITGTQFISDIVTGTSPFVVASTTVVTNLNADLLDGLEGSAYSPVAGSGSLVTTGTISSGTWEGTTIAVNQGGTGQTTYTNGQLLIGNTTGNTLAKATLTAGTGITVTNGTGTITISADVASIDHGTLAGLADDDHTQYILVDGTRAFTGNQAGLTQTAGDNSTRLATTAYVNALDVASNGSNFFGGDNSGTSISGSLNVAVGPSALRDIGAGTSNVAIGTNAALLLTTGSDNIAIGHQALDALLTTIENVAIGSSALGLCTGGGNIALGLRAGDNITTGGNNLIIGYDIDAQSATASNQMSIGNLIFSQGISGTGTSLSAGDIGIGVIDPDTKLEVFDSAATQLKLSFDATDNTTFGVDTNGDLNIVTSGDAIYIGADDIGRDLSNFIRFQTDNEIGFWNNGVEAAKFHTTGELDMFSHSIGFSLQTATGDGTTTIDWGAGNKFKFTFGAFNEVFTFTAPTNPGGFTLIMVQDGVGSRTATWPASVKWVSGTAPTLSVGIAAVDIISFVYDGTNYYGMIGTNFS